MSTKQIVGSELFKHTNVRARVLETDQFYREINLPMTIYRWDTPRSVEDWKITRAESAFYLTTTLRNFPEGNSLILYRTIGIRERFLLGMQTDDGKWFMNDGHRGTNKELLYENRSARDSLARYAVKNRTWLRDKLAPLNAEVLEQQNLAEQPLKWYVKLQHNLKRSGLRGFGTIPVGLMPELWEREMDPKNLSVSGSPHSRIRFTFMYKDTVAERITVSWPNLIFIENGNYIDIKYPAVAWLKENCIGRIVPFSAFPSMFIEPIDEIMYQGEFTKVE